jgi:hypothetical protein
VITFLKIHNTHTVIFLTFRISSFLGLGPREYDWTKKGTFLVDPTECGDLLSLDTSRPSVEFIHDPNAGAEKAGQIMKKMKWAYSPDGKGLFVSLQVGMPGMLLHCYRTSSILCCPCSRTIPHTPLHVHITPPFYYGI